MNDKDNCLRRLISYILKYDIGEYYGLSEDCVAFYQDRAYHFSQSLRMLEIRFRAIILYEDGRKLQFNSETLPDNEELFKDSGVECIQYEICSKDAGTDFQDTIYKITHDRKLQTDEKQLVSYMIDNGVYMNSVNGSTKLLELSYFCFGYNDSIKMVSMLQSLNIPIHGVDVYHHDDLEFGWGTESLSKDCYNETLTFIDKWSRNNRTNYSFSFVFRNIFYNMT